MQNSFIREAIYPEQISNPILVKNPNEKWRLCIDFLDVNRTYLKDNILLPKIDQLEDSIVRHELLSFMDVYSGYNYILMFRADEEDTCYKVMPFEFKNVGATYQKLVNMMFAQFIGKTVEVYMDDMLVKSFWMVDHINHLENSFQFLRKFRMRLNPLKCAFGQHPVGIILLIIRVSR